MMMINTLFISTAFLLFALMIIILKPNLLFVLFALEIILLGVNLNFVMGSLLLDDALGKYFTLILFSVAALDTAVGLIILLNYYGLHTITRSRINIKA